MGFANRGHGLQSNGIVAAEGAPCQVGEPQMGRAQRQTVVEGCLQAVAGEISQRQPDAQEKRPRQPGQNLHQVELIIYRRPGPQDDLVLLQGGLQRLRLGRQAVALCCCGAAT